MAPSGAGSLRSSWLRLADPCSHTEVDEDEDREAQIYLLQEAGPAMMGGATRRALLHTFPNERSYDDDDDEDDSGPELGPSSTDSCRRGGGHGTHASSTAPQTIFSRRRHFGEGTSRSAKVSIASLAVGAIVISTLLVSRSPGSIEGSLAGQARTPTSLATSEQEFQSLAALLRQPRYCGSGGRSEPKGGGVVNLVGAMLPPAPFTLTVHVRARDGDADPGLENILAWPGLGKKKDEDCAALAITSKGHLQWREEGQKIVEARSINLRDGAWHRVAVTREASGEVNLFADDVLLAGDRANSQSSANRCGFVAHSASWKSDKATFNGDIGTLRLFASSLSLGDIDGAFGPCYSPESLNDVTTTSTRTTTPTTTTTLPTTTTVTTTTLPATTTTHKASPAPSPPSPSNDNNNDNNKNNKNSNEEQEPWQSWLSSSNTHPTFPPVQGHEIPADAEMVGCHGRSSFDDIDSICEGLPEKNCEMLSNCRWSDR